MGLPTNDCFGNVDVHVAVGLVDGEVGSRCNVNIIAELTKSNNLADIGLGAYSDAWREKHFFLNVLTVVLVVAAR